MHQRDLHGADAVGDRVVELHGSRRPSPSARPSTTVNSHSGRARSKPCMAIGSARSSTARRPVAARRARPAQVVVEVEVGVDLPAGGRSTSGVLDDPLAQAGDQAGAPLDHGRAGAPGRAGGRAASTAVMVERSSGSFSMVHMSASESLMRRSKRMSSAMGPTLVGRRSATAFRCSSALGRSGRLARQQCMPSPGRYLPENLSIAVWPSERKVRVRWVVTLVHPAPTVCLVWAVCSAIGVLRRVQRDGDARARVARPDQDAVRAWCS